MSQARKVFMLHTAGTKLKENKISQLCAPLQVHTVLSRKAQQAYAKPCNRKEHMVCLEKYTQAFSLCGSYTNISAILCI